MDAGRRQIARWRPAADVSQKLVVGQSPLSFWATRLTYMCPSLPRFIFHLRLIYDMIDKLIGISSKSGK